MSWLSNQQVADFLLSLHGEARGWPFTLEEPADQSVRLVAKARQTFYPESIVFELVPKAEVTHGN